MLIQRTNPVGADVQIQRFQSLIHSGLVKKWGIQANDTVYRCYSRCYRNKTTDGYIAENYEGSNEYKEVYWDDTLSALSFFGLSGPADFNTGTMTTGVHLVFFVNLQKLYPSISHRADEEVHKDVLSVIGKGMHGHTLTDITYWIENVLREYPGSRRDNRLAYVDMHPIHCFRLNFSLNYNINNC
ncbi:tail terminator protein [Pseudanabaena phage Pan5]|nr:tail terminator protein [Pseudanabaena phage Pan5]